MSLPFVTFFGKVVRYSKLCKYFRYNKLSPIHDLCKNIEYDDVYVIKYNIVISTF